MIPIGEKELFINTVKHSLRTFDIYSRLDINPLYFIKPSEDVIDNIIKRGYRNYLIQAEDAPDDIIINLDDVINNVVVTVLRYIIITFAYQDFYTNIISVVGENSPFHVIDTHSYDYMLVEDFLSTRYKGDFKNDVLREFNIRRSI